MFPVSDYTTLLAGFQRGLVLLVLGIFAFSVVKSLVSAVLALYCGEPGASVISSAVFFAAVMLFIAYALVHHGMAGMGLSIPDPFRAVDGVIFDLTSTLNAF